ncbi:putative DEAD-box ATP-dependent RNA helicase 29 [Tanacetum coccineum]
MVGDDCSVLKMGQDFFISGRDGLARWVLKYTIYVSFSLLAGLSGYMATVTNLKDPLEIWRCGAAPINDNDEIMKLTSLETRPTVKKVWIFLKDVGVFNNVLKMGQDFFISVRDGLARWVLKYNIYVSFSLLAGLSGYMATVTNLKDPLEIWRCGAAPINGLIVFCFYELRLASEVVEVQEVYDLMERKEEFGGGGLKLEAKKDDGSNKCAPSVRLESVVLDLASHDSSGLQKQKSTYHLDKRSKKYVKLNNGDQVSASGKVDTAKKEEVLTSVDYYYDMQYSKPRVVPNIGPSLVPKELSYAGEVENIMKSDKSEGSTPTLLDLYVG